MSSSEQSTGGEILPGNTIRQGFESIRSEVEQGRINDGKLTLEERKNIWNRLSALKTEITSFQEASLKDIFYQKCTELFRIIQIEKELEKSLQAKVVELRIEADPDKRKELSTNITKERQKIDEIIQKLSDPEEQQSYRERVKKILEPISAKESQDFSQFGALFTWHLESLKKRKENEQKDPELLKSDSVQGFFEIVNQSDDTLLRKTLLDLGNALKQELENSSQHKKGESFTDLFPSCHGSYVKMPSPIERAEMYKSFREKHANGEYQILVDIGENQEAYMIDPFGIPIIKFTISSGKGSRTPTTPMGKPCEIVPPGNGSATRFYTPARKDGDIGGFGQAWKKHVPEGKIHWEDGLAQMTTAVLKTNLPGDVYYFHGTNYELRLGEKDSGGCIRMSNLSIALLSIFYEKHILKQKKTMKVTIIKDS